MSQYGSRRRLVEKPGRISHGREELSRPDRRCQALDPWPITAFPIPLHFSAVSRPKSLKIFTQKATKPQTGTLVVNETQRIGSTVCFTSRFGTRSKILGAF